MSLPLYDDVISRTKELVRRWDLDLLFRTYLSFRGKSCVTSSASSAASSRAGCSTSVAAHNSTRKFLKCQQYCGIERSVAKRPPVLADVTHSVSRWHVRSALCTAVLEHLPEPGACLDEIHRVVKPGGAVFFTVPMTMYTHSEPYDFYRYTEYGLRYLLEKHGFQIIGFCAGGIISTTLLNHLAAQGDTRVHSMSYAVTMLDWGQPEQLGAFSSTRVLEFAKSRSRRKGLISARDMGSAFTWLRPDDLVFNYWVNNYLMGRKPPAFDILAWNADGTNLPGALHGQFLDIFAHNLLVKPKAYMVLGTPIELDRIKVPTFVVGAIADHLTTWQNCYRTTQLLGGDSTFVLSYSGHIASLVNPPGNPKAHYWAGGEPGRDPQAWLAGATRTPGSWWEAWADWVSDKAGTQGPAPASLGSDRHKPLVPAPGRYVRDLAPK